MNCCINCFRDNEIRAFIINYSTEVRDCDCCDTKTTNVIDTRELEEQFQNIISLYKTVTELGITASDPKLIHVKIQETWNIFALTDIAVIQQLITSAVSASPTDLLFSEPVEIELFYIAAPAGDAHEKKWSNLSDEIKNTNRFFLKESIDLVLLASLLQHFSRSYLSGKIFYRVRVSDKTGFTIDKMGSPPPDVATSGRANPKGIPYLYVATAAETAIYESKASFLDYVSIAEFKLKESIQVISLRNIEKLSPFALGDKISDYLSHQKYLTRLEQELSKPIRKYDKELDYLPSQYLCEYVKSLGYDAIEYGSSQKTGGINLAIFSEGKIEVTKVEVFEITDVNLVYNKL